MKSKKLYFVLATVLGMCIQTIAYTQLDIRLKAGVQSYDIDANELWIFDKEDLHALTLSVEEADYGLHFGIEMRLNLGRYYIAPEFLFSTNRVDYSIKDINDLEVIGKIFSEKYNYLNIPLNIGRRFGPFSFFVGPVGHLFINSTSDLFDIEGYSQKFKTMTYGWNAGVGLQISRFGVQLRHEGNFSYFGDHIRFFDKNFNFSDRPSRLLASFVMQF